MLPSLKFQLIQNRVTLTDGERSHAERSCRILQSMLHDSTHDCPGFRPVRGRTASVEHAVLDEMELESQGVAVRFGAGNHSQLTAVEFLVGNSDQRMMPAAVMPSQHPLSHILGGTQTENALHVAGVQFRRVGRVIVIDHPLKESRRRQLTIVADDNDLLAARNRSECINRRNLAGFVNHQHFESQTARLQKLGDRRRTHHEDRLDRLDGTAGLGKQPPEREVTSFLLDLAADDSDLTDVGCLPRHAVVMNASQAAAGQQHVIHIELAKTIDQLLVRKPGARVEFGMSFKEPFTTSHAETVDDRGRADSTVADSAAQLAEAVLNESFVPLSKSDPQRQCLRLLTPVRQALSEILNSDVPPVRSFEGGVGL